MKTTQDQTDTSSDLDIYARRESAARSYCRAFPTEFTTASGAIMTDADGRDYIDFLAGCSSLNYGHNDPDMKAALMDYLSKDGLTHGLDMHSAAKRAFLEAFEDKILTPRDMNYKVMMTGPTGTNAVEAAIKLARKVTGRRNVVSFTNGFHGMTMGSLALTGNKGKRAGAGGGSLADVTHLPYEHAFGEGVDTLAIAREMLGNPSSGIDAPAAFILEPVQGEGGLNAASREWLQGITELAKEHGALLILDDIQAGCGRTGPFFSFEDMGVEPDLIPMAKSLSGMGLPFAMLLIKPQFDIWGPAEHNGTFRGNNHAFVTARVALEKFWSNGDFQTQTMRKAEMLEDALREVAELTGGRLKGRGMMRGVDVGSGELAGAICARCFDNGLIIETSGAHDEVVKVLAPLSISDEVFTKGLTILKDAARAEKAATKIAAE